MKYSTTKQNYIFRLHEAIYLKQIINSILKRNIDI